MFASTEATGQGSSRSTNLISAITWHSFEYGLPRVKKALLAYPIHDPGSNEELHEALSVAVSSGNESIVRLLLERGDVDIATQDSECPDPLLLAAERGFIAIVRLLIKEGGNPNAKDKHGQTPLIRAIIKFNPYSGESFRSVAKYDPEGVVKLLLECNNINLNAQDSNRRTALSYAAQLGYLGFAELLISHKTIQPHVPDQYGRTALSYAAEFGHHSVVKLLLRPPLDTSFYERLQDKTGRTPLSWALAPSNATKDTRVLHIPVHEVVEYLLEFANREEANKLMLKPDHQGRTALSLAVGSSWLDNRVHSELVRLLLKADSAQLGSIDQEGRTILSRAAELGCLTFMEMLMEHKDANLDIKDRDGRAPLLVAAAKGHHTVVAMILRVAATDPTKVDLNSHDRQNWTALQIAADAGHRSVVETLIGSGLFKKECTDESDDKPIILAARKGFDQIVLYLADPTIALHTLARDERTLRYVKLLKDHGHEVSHKDRCGSTPLHEAALRNQPKFVEELLRWGADTDAEDSSGVTALVLAVKHRREEAALTLLQHSESRVGVSHKDWFALYGRQTSSYLLRFLEHPGGQKSVQFEHQSSARLLLENNRNRQIVFFDNFTLFCTHLQHSMNHVSILERLFDIDRDLSDIDEVNLWTRIRNYGNFASIIIIGQYPTERYLLTGDAQEESFWGKIAIVWNITPPLKSEDGVAWVSTSHFSMIQHDWIPTDGAAFFILFLQAMRARWLIFCDEADDGLSQRRLDQLLARGNDVELIGQLAKDAQNLAMLRTVLQSQIRSAKEFVQHYCQPYDHVDNRRLMQNSIDAYGEVLNERIRVLEQTVRDLLQFEFAWVSINEAHRSISIATSVKRLSWITFVFLPAMFASSLFGMNVNILASNPDWRWFLLFAGSLLVATISVWLLFKYGQVETRIEQIFGKRIQRLSQGPKKSGSLRSEP